MRFRGYAPVTSSTTDKQIKREFQARKFYVTVSLSGTPIELDITFEYMVATQDEENQSNADAVSVTVTIEENETYISVAGERDTAVVVRSDSGERVYLPPENFEESLSNDSDDAYQSASSSPYQSQNSSPYQGSTSDTPYSGSSSSPYQSASGDSPYQPVNSPLPEEGLTPTADGYQIRHPEPVSDIRVLR